MLHGYQHNLHLKKLIKKWDDDADLMSRCAVLQIEVNHGYMKALRLIINMLTVNCKHPKKYRDKTGDGIWYCMNCNADL